jgi:hypothetical protein
MLGYIWTLSYIRYAYASHIIRGAPHVVTNDDLIAAGKQERKGSRRLVPATKTAGVTESMGRSARSHVS